MSAASDRRPIVVGVSSEPSPRPALAWASDEAALRRLPLRAVHAEGLPTRGDRGREIPPSWAEWNQALHEAGSRVLDEAVRFVSARHPRVEVDTLLAEGEPSWVLREQSRDAAFVVLGSQHLSRAQQLFSPASVALPVAAQAHCPVVVLSGPEHTTQDPPYYVVGVDGSERSGAAVDVAFEEAALRGAGVRALYAWQTGPLGFTDEEAARQECTRLLSEIVAGRGDRWPEVELRHELVVGHPVQTLTEASEHALGVVVGTRGRGGFTGMLLGSVSQGMLHHARCPVIVVPPPK